MSVRTRIVTVVVFLAVVSSYSFAQTNLLTNGSFEQGKVLTSRWDTLYSGDNTSITGWTVTRSDVDYVGGPNWFTASDGTRCVNLNGSYNAGGLRQTIATTAGQKYKVTFDLAADSSDVAPHFIAQMVVAAAGQSGTFTFDNAQTSIGNMKWASGEWLFTAASASTMLEFYSLNSGSQGPVLDNTKMFAVPEPATLLLLAAGLPLVRRKTRAGK